MISRKVATSASTEGDLSSCFHCLHAQEQNLLHAKQRVIDGVRAILNQVFDDDDMIFNMAEKSETNAEQAKYFDYLNQVRCNERHYPCRGVWAVGMVSNRFRDRTSL